MAYRLAVTEHVETEVRRVATEQIEKALTEIEAGDIEFDECIHQVRKRVKKLRGLLRLVRPAFGKQYALENKQLRGIGRGLSPLRDADAAVESLEALAKRTRQREANAAFPDARGILLRNRARLREETQDESGRITQVRDALQHTHERVRSWRLDSRGFQALAGGLGRTYRRGRSAYKQAIKSDEADAFHEWRKRVKYHWYHVRLLQSLWPGPMKARRNELRSLSGFLGEDHDLTVLETHLATGEWSGDAKREHLERLIRERRSELRTAAVLIGRRVFAEKPKPLIKRFKTYWRATNQAVESW